MQAGVERRYNFRMMYDESGQISMKFSKRGSMVIIEDGCDEIMQTFMSGQNKEWEAQGFLFVNDDGEIEDPLSQPPL